MTLSLNRKGQKISNNISSFIRTYASSLDLYFEVCKLCTGSGLAGTHKMQEGGHSWDGTFCEKCEGVGFTNWRNPDIIDICEECEGEGCKLCGNKGIVDWIQKATGVR